MTEFIEAEADSLRARLQPFLARNPEASVSVWEGAPAVFGAWGEEGLVIVLDPGEEALLTALNEVRLPPRFTALWHDDTEQLEVIYRALGVGSGLRDRRFTFRFKGEDYACYFGLSSDRLLEIARAADSLGQTAQGKRNLRTFKLYARISQNFPERALRETDSPVSFWIEGFREYKEEDITDLVRNLNFFMEYFDRETPKIRIHEEPSDFSLERSRHQRYPSGDFPPLVSGRDINQHLLGLWESARTGDSFLRFIQYYQILEYAGFYHIRNNIMQDIQRIIVAPEAAARPGRAARDLLDLVVDERLEENTKINEVIKKCVSAEEMWHALGDDREHFSKEIVLDGGFVLPAVVSMSEGLGDFKKSWHQRFPPALHSIRNRLVHGRESRQATMIVPSRANRDRLFPWLGPLAFTAARVMVYSDL
ncbi:MAG: hypothetical protein F4Z77_13200 [Dehalococcoidia bacterium]|nr:hypothetical protein [Dehalococcoidia bacterium]MYA54532.1 hypothetical protein [Dehalococcoidia bacterium]